MLQNRVSKAEVAAEVADGVAKAMLLGIFGYPVNPNSPLFTPGGQICMPKLCVNS